MPDWDDAVKSLGDVPPWVKFFFVVAPFVAKPLYRWINRPPRREVSVVPHTNGVNKDLVVETNETLQHSIDREIREREKAEGRAERIQAQFDAYREHMQLELEKVRTAYQSLEIEKTREIARLNHETGRLKDDNADLMERLCDRGECKERLVKPPEVKE